MTNATFSLEANLSMVGGFPSASSCDVDGENVQITRIGLPINYDDVNFDFQGLGDFANNAINGIGVYVLQSQEDVMVAKIKDTIKRKFNSLIC